jgi:hypothetical protein
VEGLAGGSVVFFSFCVDSLVVSWMCRGRFCYAGV